MSRPRWRFLITPRWLAWHAFTVLAAWGMLWLGDWQFHRAEGGNPLSWAYTFEWPIFTMLGVIFWVKTIVDEWRAQGAPASTAARADAAESPALPGYSAAECDDDADDDPELAAYNAYLAKLDKRNREEIRGAF